MRLQSGKKRGKTWKWIESMSRRPSGRISPFPRNLASQLPASPGSWPDIFPRENIDTVHRTRQADFEKSSKEEERGRERMHPSKKKRLVRGVRGSALRHWRTEFNYTTGMTDTLMGGRGSSSNFGNTFPAFLSPRPGPSIELLRSLTRWRVMMGQFARNETWRSAKRMLDAWK